MRNIHKCKISHDSLVVFKTVLGERRNMHTHMHCPAVYSGSILQGVTHMKISSSKMDIPLKFMVKTFEIQTFFLDTIHYWEVFLSHIKNILINSLFNMLINPFSPSEKVQLRGFDSTQIWQNHDSTLKSTDSPKDLKLICL